jgi:ABC-type multidrug transport system ATPase subunit
MASAVSVRSISCLLDRLVFDQLSFEIDAGERVLLLGRNGIGKSTLLRCLAGLTRLHRGAIERGEGPIAFVGHASMFYLNLTLEANLDFFSKMNRSPFPNELVERFGLREFLGVPVHSLSQGTRSKGALVRALSTNAKLLLLDEPSSNLDDDAVGTLLEEIEEWSKPPREGVVIVATHDIGRVVRVATRALLLDDGGITSSSSSPEGIESVLNAYREVNR